MQSAKTGDIRAGGCHVCGSVWHCPQCAAVVTDVRAADLIEATGAWTRAGNAIAMLTLTVPHLVRDSLADLWSQLRRAMGLLRADWAWKEATCRVAGFIRATEVTVGRGTGWHPHFHVLVFHQGPVTEADRASMQLAISAAWQRVAVRAGLSRPHAEHGCNLVVGKTVHERLGAYLAKMGRAPSADSLRTSWGAERELAKWHTKRASDADRFTPFQLLDGFAAGGVHREWFKARFLEYAVTFRGQRQLVWSRGLKTSLLALGAQLDDRPDEAAATDVPDEETQVASASITEWNWLVRFGLAEAALAALRDDPRQITLDLFVAVSADRRDALWLQLQSREDPPPWPDSGRHDLTRQSAA